MKPLILWLWLAQGADITTTLVGIHRGCEERTYWSGRPSVIVGGKLAGSLGLTIVLRQMPTRTMKGLVVGVAAGATVATVLNLRTLPHCGR